jgi:asparagine synthetase B (glutamine-hydrolysing)
LCSRWPDNQETFFEAVRRIPPGWRAVIDRGQLTLDRYWDPVPRYDRPIDWMSPGETERFSDVLDVAVRRCLGFGPTAVFLSGGFDSVSIAAVASDQARRTGAETPRALSLAFPDAACDERDRQTGVARALGLPLGLVDFHEAAGPSGLLGEGLALNRGLASPLFNVWAPAYLELARRGSRLGVRTILTGSGGDEWLGVSPFLGADLMRRGDVAGFIRFARAWRRSYTQTMAQVVRGAVWTFALRPLAGMMAHRLMPETWDRSRLARGHRMDPAWVAPGAALRSDLRQRARAGLAEADPPGGFYARESRAFIDHALMSRDLEEQYEFGARLGVRFMHPYWDPDLAAQIYRTPPERLLKGGRAKGLVRDSVARRFPGLGFERQRKVSAQAFFTATVAAQGPAVFRTIGDFTALAAIGVVNPAGARAMVEDGFRRQSREMLVANQLFSLEMWAREYVN